MTIEFDTYPDMMSDYENDIENENYDYELRVFTVPKEWAVSWIRNIWGMDFKEFMDTYTWDDTYQMYVSAKYAQVILEEHIISRDW